MIIEATYLLYLILSIAITVWVGNTLSKNGLVFLMSSFNNKKELVEAITHMLLVGFYLINIGFVALALRHGSKPSDLQTSIEYVSTKVGLVLLVLGAMHLFIMLLINKFRKIVEDGTEHDEK